ncbi:hypothetical protein [Aquabacterium humicola]|uniref:hypothetical protein n=1 Tax=Aquabacterium humicola TaxID=3237377 RepID=UPI0025438715|nr:hypothetical protein [Rubrivivax pictus]
MWIAPSRLDRGATRQWKFQAAGSTRRVCRTPESRPAAICLIHGIDDSSFRDNIVYPKDLIDWARANDSLGKLKAAAEDALRSGEPRLRCQSGDACPRDGYWFTPARADSRQYFRAGQVMPDVGGPWGLTIWQSDT